MKISFALLGLASVAQVGTGIHVWPKIDNDFRLMIALQLISAMPKTQLVINNYVVWLNGIAMIHKQLASLTSEPNVRVMPGEQ